MIYFRQEIDKRVREKCEDFEASKKNQLRLIESLQASLEAESRSKAELIRTKKKLETDIQELENGNLAFVESNKLTVRYHEISVEILDFLRDQLNPAHPGRPISEGPVLTWDKLLHHSTTSKFRAPVLPDLKA